MNEFKFSCPHCGQHLAASPDWIGRAFKCPTSQNEFAVLASSTIHATATAAPTPGAPAVPPPPAATWPPAPAPTPSGKTSGLAIASLVCGLVPCLGGLPAVICGHIGLSHINRGRAAKGKGLATAGLILGYLSIALSLAALVQFSLVGPVAYKAVQEAQRQTQEGQGIQRGPSGPRNSGPVDPAPETTETSSSELSLGLEISPNAFFAPKEAYDIGMTGDSLGTAFWESSAETGDFKLDSNVLKGQGKLRITAPQKVEISFNVNSSKPFRLQLSGLTQATIQLDGDALDLSKPVPAGKWSIVITGGVSPNAASPNQGGPRATTDTSSSEPSLSLEISPNTFFAPKEIYNVRMENSGLSDVSWQSSWGGGEETVDFKLDSNVLKGQGKLRITAPQKVEISFNVNSSKPFRLQLSGLTQATVQLDGDAFGLSKPVPAGKRSIVITGGVSPNAASPNQGGPRAP